MYEKTQKLYEEVAGKLQEEIRTGTYQPGDRLPSERILSQEYGVSRSVIRRSLSFIGADGMRGGENRRRHLCEGSGDFVYGRLYVDADQSG